MIHPNMATMIGVLLTDAFISQEMLQNALIAVVNKSFNRISVDGDTSVCDIVIILANGKAANKKITQENEDYETFVAALEKISVTLSRCWQKTERVRQN